MKTLLLLLVIILAATAYHFQSSASKTRKAMEVAITALESQKKEFHVKVTALIAEKDAATETATAMAEKVTELEAQLVEARTNSVTDELLARQIDREQSAAEAEKSARSEADKQLARDQAALVYQRNKSILTEQQAQATAALSTAKAALVAKKENAPRFNEQGKDERNGNVVATGLRKSQTDRDIIINKHESELLVIAAQIAAAEAEMVRVKGRSNELEAAYAAALTKLQ